MIVTIREAKQEDYDQMIQLLSALAEEDGGRYKKKDSDSFLKVIDNPNSFVYVAQDKDKLIGYIFFSTRLLITYPKQIMQVEDLVVLESHREQGIGRRLMETMEEKARDLDCQNIYIQSSYKRETAHKFYESLHYENTGYYFKKVL